MPYGNGYGQDDRKSGASGAYGANSQGGGGFAQSDPFTKNPFSDPFWQNAMGGGTGGGVPLGGGGSNVMDPTMFQPQNIAGTNITGAEALGGGGLGGIRGALDALGLTGRDALGLGAAGLSAMRGNRPTSAEQDIERLLALAEGRINQSEPLFQALMAMANASLPRYARGG